MNYICPIHQKTLKVGKNNNLFCPTPVLKDASGAVVKWCDYHPELVPAPEMPTPVPVAQTQTPTNYSPRPFDLNRDDNKQKMIVKQSCISSLSRIVATHPMYIDKTLDELVPEIIEAADQLVEYVYSDPLKP